MTKKWNSSIFSEKTVEQFHFFWNCFTKSGTVSLYVGLLGYCPADKFKTTFFHQVDPIFHRSKDDEFKFISPFLKTSLKTRN
jgi:hypothetical protein